MSFVSFSPQVIKDGVTPISNIFLVEYLPRANGDIARVYLYGYYICSERTRNDITLEQFALELNLSPEDVLGAFHYWGELGLVKILNLSPLEIKYLPVKSGGARMLKYPKGKYEDFIAAIQLIIGAGPDIDANRDVTKTEIQEYCDFMDSMGVEPAAFLMIAKYCVDLKGANIGWKYIINVAKTWAYADIKTAAAVEQKLKSMHLYTDIVRNILAVLRLKRGTDHKDFELFEKWTKTLGFDTDTILAVAATARGSMARLDTMLAEFHAQNKITLDDINTAKQVTSATPAKVNMIRHSYKPEDLDKLYSNLDEVKFK